MNIRNQLICAHMAPIWLFTTYIGLVLMTGWLPPFSAALEPAQIAQELSNKPMMRVGFAIIAFVSPLFMGMAAPIAVQLKRIEGKSHVFSNLQLCSAAVGVLALQFPGIFWLTATYRPGISPDVVAAFSDCAFFLIIGGVSPAIMQNLCIGLGILSTDKPHDIYPRWLGFWNIWLAFTFVPGALLPFFHTGPFSWNGIFGFWVVLVGFFGWMMLNYIYTLKAIYKQRDSETATMPA